MTRDEILIMIDEEDIQFIRLQFTDIFGRMKNIAVTPAQMDRVFGNRQSFEGRAVFGGKYKCDEKLYLHPELDSFTLLPWRPRNGKVAVMNCDICYEDGRPFEFSSRNILKRTLDSAEKEGYSFIVDPQCEFFLFQTDENGLPTTISHEKAGYLDVAPVDFGENARHDIVLMLEDMGFEIESSHHEDAPAQHEIDFREAEAMKTADNLQLFRFAVKSIAKEFGLHATFMPKPRNDIDGSGMHVNLTMLKDNKNIFRNEDGSVSEAAYHFMGGILAHGKALTAIANPTVNSFKRLILGCQAPERIFWASKGEDSFIKLKHYSNDVKLELRFPDGTSNPYLLIAACIEAGFDGIRNATNPGGDMSQSKSDEPLGECVPQNLKEAVDCLMNDEVVKNALGEEFAEAFAQIKYEEWSDYWKYVSAWEIENYLTVM